MQNTLKIVLLIVGIGLTGYGIYTVIFPHISLTNGVTKVKAVQDNTQSYAMIGLGVLSLLAGIAFQKR